jgi:hypothetical protein
LRGKTPRAQKEKKKKKGKQKYKRKEQHIVSIESTPTKAQRLKISKGNPNSNHYLLFLIWNVLKGL